MKYAIIALLLIGLSVKGQDSTLIGSASGRLSTGQFSFKVDSSLPRESFSAELVVYDSLKMIGYQKKDSTLVIIGDSARFIRVLLESMAYYSKFKVRFPEKKHSYDPYKDLIWKMDTEALLPKGIFDTPTGITIHANDAHSDDGKMLKRGKYSYGKNGSEDTFFVNDSVSYSGCQWDVRLGGPLPDSLRQRPINFDSFYLTSHGLVPKYPKDTIYAKSGYIHRWIGFDIDQPKPYPWWKKALWVWLGIIIGLGVGVSIKYLSPKN